MWAYLNKQNKNLNSFLTNSISEISITKQFLSEIKTKKNSDYNLYLNELKLENNKTKESIDSNKIILKNGKVVSKLKAKYLNMIDMFAPVKTTSTIKNNLNTQIIKNNSKQIIMQKKTNNSNINFIFNKCSDNKINKLLNF